MEFISKCDACGHVEAAYSHHLNVQMVKALRQLVDFHDRERRGCNLQKDLMLSKNQYNNFQKLQYFGLAFRTKEGWWPEFAGFSFIHGEKACYDKVATFKKSILSAENEFWQNSNKKPRPIFVKDIDLSSWKPRQDYQTEKSTQLHIF